MTARILEFRDVIRFIDGQARAILDVLRAVHCSIGGRFRCMCCAALLLLSGCEGVQSALDPAGQEAERIANLFWWMTGGAITIWLSVIALAFYCVRSRPESYSQRKERLLIVGGGAILPTVVLSVLLVFGLKILPSLLEPAPADSLRIAVSGELWWWRVRYEQLGREPVVLANEIHLPVGKPVEFLLDSHNVIHSFWIPALAGKVDMIPGRVTHLTLTPTRTGIFRGVCAEYCGTSHALMKFDVVVEEKEDFDLWLANQAKPAESPAEPLALRGRDAFFANGCSACHALRGTTAAGVIGPDLTHLGSRRSLAAGTLPNEADVCQQWIADSSAEKPGSLMPKFAMRPSAELQAIAAYLEGLK